MDKIKFTTTFDKELLKEIKIQAVKENRSVSDLLEQLTREYLEKVSKEWYNGIFQLPRKSETTDSRWTFDKIWDSG